MNKKYFSYIVITILCLNLLPQTSNAFTLNETRDDVIYNDELEKLRWTSRYLIYARHLKFINKTGTMVDIAKKAEKDPDLIPEIMERTLYERGKAIVKWERDNGYIDTEGEELFAITPTVRRQMLAEIDEEEEKTETFWWKIGKAGLKVLSFGVTFAASVYAIYSNKEKTTGTGIMQVISGAAIKATNVMSAILTGVEGIEATCAWSWKKSKKNEEVKLPPLINMPKIPKGYKKIDIYSL